MYTTSYLTYELLAKRYALLLCNLGPCVAGFYTVRDGRNKVIVIIDNNIFKIFITAPLQNGIFKYNLPRENEIKN